MKTSPLFAVIHKNGEMFYHDLDWGQTWAEGSGYLGCLPWGEETARRGFCKDNRVLVDLDDCEVYELGWTRIDDTESPRLELVVEGSPKPGQEEAR